MKKLSFSIWLCFAFGILNAQVPSSKMQSNDQSIGFNANDLIDGNYVGGISPNGKVVFNSNIKRKDFIVNNKADLISALTTAKEGQIIYINNGVTIDLTGIDKLVIPSGVTLMGGRGITNNLGALIYTTSSGVRSLFVAGGNNVKISGLRIRGGDQKILAGTDAFANAASADKKNNYMKLYNKNMYGTPVSSGIETKYDNLEVSNCELYGWTYAAIYLQKGANNAYVHHCYIHHNQRFGLGYGIVLNSSTALIKANLFNFNRHSVAGTGREGTGYEACYNSFRENNNMSWSVDMHGGKDRNDGSDLAGSYINVHNNQFRVNKGAKAVVIRGTPSESSNVYNNDIIYIGGESSDEAEVIQQRNSKGNFNFKSNRVKL